MNLYPRANHGPLWAALLVMAAYALLTWGGTGIMECGLAWFAVMGAGYFMLDYWIRNRSEERVREDIAASETEDFRIVAMFSRMAPEQITAMAETRIAQRHIFPPYGDDKHVYLFPQGMNRPALEFTRAEVMAVWGVCNEFNFARLSTWNEGTRNRLCAEAMYQHFLARNYLLPWSGPNPAAWKDGGYDRADTDLNGRKQ